MSWPSPIYVAPKCNLFFIFSLIFVIINHIITLKQTHMIFAYFFRISNIILDGITDEERK